MPFLRLRVFVFFALGYFMSYLFRGVNIGFAPFITRDLGLGAGDLGLLTSLYYFIQSFRNFGLYPFSTRGRVVPPNSIKICYRVSKPWPSNILS